MAKNTVGELKELAQQYCVQGKRLQAAETYQKIILEEPQNPRWPQKAGEEYRTVGRKDLAIAMFQAAARLNAGQGFTLKAITLCKLVLELDKANQVAKQLLASFSAGAAPPLPPRPRSQPQPQPQPPIAPPTLKPSVRPAPSAPPVPVERPAVSKPETPSRPAGPSSQPQPRARTAPEAVTWPVLAGSCTGDDLTESVELIETQVAADSPDQGKEPGPPSGPVAFTISPGDTLETVDLAHALPPPGASPQFDTEDIEIYIDEPEPAEAAPAASPKDDILTRLPPVPIFSSLGKSAMCELVERAEVRDYQTGARLITQGEAGNSLFVLVEGEVAVVHEGPPRVELTRLGEGAFFGEIALITKVPRTATVEAVRPCQVLEISRAVFNELVSCYPEMVRVVLRHLRERLVQGLVERHPLFAPFAGAERTHLVRKFSLVEAPQDCLLAEEGVRSKALCIMLCGTAESGRRDGRTTGLTTGDLVGVESLLTGQPSLVTVKTLSKCWILKMREETFREVILTYSPVLAALSEMTGDQSRKSDAAAVGGAPGLRGIPLY